MNLITFPDRKEESKKQVVSTLDTILEEAKQGKSDKFVTVLIRDDEVVGVKGAPNMSKHEMIGYLCDGANFLMNDPFRTTPIARAN